LDACVALYRNQALRKVNNFHSVMAILAGLCMAAVSRLRYTIKDLPNKLVTVRSIAVLAVLTYRYPTDNAGLLSCAVDGRLAGAKGGRDRNELNGFLPVVPEAPEPTDQRARHSVHVREERPQLATMAGSPRSHTTGAALVMPCLRACRGVILSDLTFIEDGNPDLTEDGMVNWTKRMMLYGVLSQFVDYQRRANFRFTVHSSKNKLLASLAADQLPVDKVR